MTSRRAYPALPDPVVYFVCEAFLEGLNAQEIATAVETEFDVTLYRTEIYGVVAEGRRRECFRLTPPRNQLLEDQLRLRFVGGRQAALAASPTPQIKEWAARVKDIHVVPKGYEATLEHVAIAAADKTYDIIRSLYDKKREQPWEEGSPPQVHVGFGAGASMMMVARHLAMRLRSAELPQPRVVLHALSSGFSVEQPSTAPVGFFSFFLGIPDLTFCGMFAPPYEEADTLENICDKPIVRQSFDAKKSIDIVVTALASREDDHGELNRFMEANGKLGADAREMLDVQQGRIGDVIFRPFNNKGPITTGVGVRAVTLFELQELVELAGTADKAVVLVAGPCADCKRSRSDALFPLLQIPSLDVWSHLVTDEETAQLCLNY